MHWLLIIIGTLILSISVSNPFYKLLIQKRIKLRAFLNLIIRVLLFIIGLMTFKFVNPSISFFLYIILFIIFFILRNKYQVINKTKKK